MRYNGIDPRTLHPGISINTEIPPGTVSSQLETLSGSTGEIVAGRTIQQGEYIVRINIAGKYKEEAWKIRAMLAAWARPTDTEVCQLVPTHWPTVAYDAILKEISPPEFVRGFATIDVIFTLPRPVARNLRPSMARGAKSAEANVMGTNSVRPTMTIIMNASQGASIAVDGKVYIALTQEFQTGDVLYISTDPPRVQLSRGGNVKDENEHIDYEQTDFEAMCKAMTPGRHTITCSQASETFAAWKDEWL